MTKARATGATAARAAPAATAWALAFALGFALACALLLGPAPAWAQAPASPPAAKPAPKPAKPPAQLQGVVTRVIDGDTLLVQPAGQAPLEVRLRDIDAPEICQAWGPEAKKALEEFTLGKSAVLKASARDGYGRVVGTLTVDEQNIGKRMVEEGHAWSLRTRWDNGPMVKQERQAKALGRGLHASAGAIPPKEFRQQRGPCPKP